MRLMWPAGDAARANNVSAYNCFFIARRKLRDFAEIMYVSMCGTGIGFSVEHQNVHALPQIKRQTNHRKVSIHAIEDSKEGWAEAFYLGLRTWFNGGDVKFDFSKIRPAGARLKTMGGKTSGPKPLEDLLNYTRNKIFSRQGGRLSSLDVHDIVCKIGEIVVMGGVRRSALISLSDLDDSEMRTAKQGQFFITEPQRSMANNSAVYNDKPSTTDFMEEWLALAKSGTGERGIFNRGSLPKQLPERRWKTFKKDFPTCGTNPCITGDTIVYVADGRGNVPIKQLADEGKDIPVFCLDGKDRVAIRYMRNPRITGKKQPIYKLKLDDGSEVKTTANHKFRLKSGEYREVQHLKLGDSLTILTRFEASIKDIFPGSNSRSQNYWWINSGRRTNVGEHRIIAGFCYNTKISSGHVVHHKDRNAQNNDPANLEILSKEEHDALHANLMIGDNNPMRRAQREWDEEKWSQYSKNMSRSVSGSKNGRFLGITNEELKKRAYR